MTISGMFTYFGTAVVYAALATAVLWAVMRIADSRARARRFVLPVFTALLLVFLALHPFPDAASMVCPRPNTDPQLRPLAFLDRVARLARAGAPVAAWLRDLTITSSIMNLVVCVAFGAALARAGIRAAVAIPCGLALSLAVETAQLTGLLGVFPCAYRQFDIDDLILNTVGTAIGVAAGGLRRRRS